MELEARKEQEEEKGSQNTCKIQRIKRIIGN
jgi:hypothetical protein